MKIVVDNVTKEFNKINVIKNINYTFENGKVYGIYGRNGSGKSVFLKIICGFYVPTTGEVLIDNVNYSNSNKYPEDFGCLIEKPSFFDDLTGFENLKLLAKIQNKINDNDILKALEIVNLVEEKDKKYRNYSLGMKQKLGIAQAIMENPRTIILDEPFNGIERESVKKIIKYLQTQKKDKLIIISSHIKEDIESLSDEFLFFDNGCITEEANLNELKGM